VSSSDPVVRENVCLIVLRIGAEVREAAMKEIARVSGDGSPIASEPWHHRAA
jgi:hypothetical protein